MTTDYRPLLTELRELLAKATPGPWEQSGLLDICGEHGERVARLAATVGKTEYELDNLRLIVAAVNALPDLLDEVEALRAEVAEWHSLHTSVACAGLNSMAPDSVPPVWPRPEASQDVAMVAFALHTAEARAARLEADAARLDMLAAEYWTLEPFDMPTGQGDADVGWRVTQEVGQGRKVEVIAEIYTDDPRAALDAARSAVSGEPNA